ncbi:hypothetical protein DEEACLCL_00009 [Salmonella phage CRW-SP2]|nr:hypothetical protein DEEACLCL_00009 [Salmonella phage CRW-SP2]
MNAQLYDVISSGNAFNNPLTSLSGTSLGLVNTGKANASYLSSVADPSIQGALTAGGLTPTKLASANTMYTNAGAGVNTLVTYGDRSVNEAYERMGTSTSYKEGLKSVGREPNNCDLINNAFGVLQTTGRQFLNAMETALSTVTQALSELKDLVAQGVSAGLSKIQALATTVSGYISQAATAVAQVVQDIETGIANELAHIESMVKSCLNFSFANIISEWYKDSCAAGIIKNLGSKDLNDSLK